MESDIGELYDSQTHLCKYGNFGLQLFRPGVCGSFASVIIHIPQHRGSIVAAWSTPVNLGPNVNSAANETRPSLSWDAKTLLFGTTRPGVEGVSDIYYSTRD